MRFQNLATAYKVKKPVKNIYKFKSKGPQNRNKGFVELNLDTR